MEKRNKISEGTTEGLAMLTQTSIRFRADLLKRVNHARIDRDKTLQQAVDEGLELWLAANIPSEEGLGTVQESQALGTNTDSLQRQPVIELNLLEASAINEKLDLLIELSRAAHGESRQPKLRGKDFDRRLERAQAQAEKIGRSAAHGGRAGERVRGRSKKVVRADRTGSAG